MKRRHRLTDKERFRLVRETGASYTHPLLVLCVLANGQSDSRTGCTVSRRLGKAVERNRVRRRISEAVRLIWDLVEPGWDMVWIARPPCKAADFTAIQAGCLRLLQRAGVLRAVTPAAVGGQAGANRDGASEIAPI